MEENGAEAAAARPARGAAPPRSGAEMRASLLRNLGYFWVGFTILMGGLAGSLAVVLLMRPRTA